MNQTRKLILVCGRPASGKSTFAKALAQRTSGTLIDIDTATEPVIRVAMNKFTGDPNDRDSPFFKETFREAIQESLFAIAKENLDSTHAIIAAPFTKEQRDPDWLNQLATKLCLSEPALAVFLSCDSDTLRKRIAERKNPRDIPKLANWDSHETYYAKEETPAFPHLLVDATSPEAISETIESIASRI